MSAPLSQKLEPPANPARFTVPELIQSVYTALNKVGTEEVKVEEALVPAVSIRASIKPEYLVCLEDGKQMKMLKRHLSTAYNLTPAEYRARWNLPSDYPMVAPAYAAKRAELAKSIGLGRKPGTKMKANTEAAALETPEVKAPAKKKRTTTRKAPAAPAVDVAE
nr:MucR family transcriptional regulator [Novosphingobium terrae]